MSLVANLVVASLMHLMMIPCDPLSMSHVFFISSSNALSFVLSSWYCVILSPQDGSPVIKEMSSTSIETGISTHRYPPWVTSIIFLMQLFTSWPLPKCVIYNRFKISMLASLATHYFGWKIGSSNGPIPMVSR
jgi:hypothetical protein